VRANEKRLANNGQSFLETGDDFCKLEYKNEDLSDLQIRLDRSKILTSGRKGELDAVKKYARDPS
jgi:dipeptidyl-peptidase-3